MKKIFLFLAVASMTAFTSCSSDDDSNGGGEKVATSILLASNVAAIEVGQSVTFTVTDNLATVVTTTSTLMANNVAITGATFAPTAAGIYAVKATYKNSQNVMLTSNVVTITVTAPVVTPDPQGKYTFGGTDYAVDNMIFQVNGSSAAGIVLVNANPEGETPNIGTLWLGVVYNGLLDGISTASHYYQYQFFIPAIENADGTFTIQFPGEADAIALDVYAENDLTPLNTDAVTGGTATFTSFDLAADIPTSNNASAFSNGATAVTSHMFDGTLEGAFYANMTGGKGNNFKQVSGQKMTMKQLKQANKSVKFKK